MRGHIYVLAVSMWPLSTVFMYKYTNAHFAGLGHAPKLSLFYNNKQHKYHTAGTSTKNDGLSMLYKNGHHK